MNESCAPLLLYRSGILSLSPKTCRYEHSQYDMKHSETKEQSVEFPPWSEQFVCFSLTKSLPTYVLIQCLRHF